MYEPGQKVQYRTTLIQTVWNGTQGGKIKTGVIEEAFRTHDNTPCYWVKGETELILHHQIIRPISC